LLAEPIALDKDLEKFNASLESKVTYPFFVLLFQGLYHYLIVPIYHLSYGSIPSNSERFIVSIASVVGVLGLKPIQD
jgi:hypothetical protein